MISKMRIVIGSVVGMAFLETLMINMTINVDMTILLLQKLINKYQNENIYLHSAVYQQRDGH
jgi:hypothetical protein